MAVMLVTTNAKVWAASTCALYVKCMVTTAVQGGKAFESGTRPPEDARLNLARRFKGVKQTYGLESSVPKGGDEKDEARLLAAREEDHRWRRIVSNDLETIPIGLLVFGAGVLTDANTAVHVLAMASFTGCRIAHTVAYARKMQPQRGYLWMAAHASVLLGAANVVVSGIFGH